MNLLQKAKLNIKFNRNSRFEQKKLKLINEQNYENI